DVYADLEPTWSPDGRTLAFATDRYTTDLTNLDIGQLQLALMDFATGEIRQLPPIKGAKMINPQWAPGGSELYFLSDRDGISNIYRMNVATGALTQVTNLFAGVSGITALSPAITVAQQSGRILYSSFRENGFIISELEPPAAEAAPQLAQLPAGTTPAMLPPQDRTGSLVVSVLEDKRTGLPPADTTFATTPYSSGLSLDYVGQPTLVAGADRFGTYLGGGVALFFSDLLGNHNLTTMLQVNGTLKDITALVGYTNVTHRLNWGVVAQQVPYLVGSFAQGTDVDPQTGEPILIQQEILERQTDRQITGLLAYPFSRTSRIEFQGGVERISFDRELRTETFSLVDGRQLTEDHHDLASLDAINLATADAALVYDNSFFGATGPILGRRMRFEVSPSFGTLNFVAGLADIRQYIMPARPFTLAFRLLHYGRYGKDGEDPRIRPLYLGEDGLVRGYSFNSFDASECHPPAGSPNACPVFDRLVGSRLGIGNVELRFPLLGVLGLGSGYYGAFPIDMVFFGDAGVAWDSQSKPDFLGGNRQTVFSAGTGLRINLFGFAIGEVDLVHPFERPDRNWVWQFSLQPGF
ncbi:MAG TPA: BamA/TamA family outer membrane protein, partial [Gemmatimonadales bacterium]|nr:BamA/TamA family outer membrane protein [Gemmatimonadales bacterium]